MLDILDILDIQDIQDIKDILDILTRAILEKSGPAVQGLNPSLLDSV